VEIAVNVRSLCAVLSLLIAAAANAQTVRYISDELVVNLRTGQTNNHAIVRMLSAGTAVEVVDQNDDSGYSHVRVRDRDLEGWVLTQYLTAQPIARDRLATAEGELVTANARIADLQMRLAALTEDAELVSHKLQQADARNAELAAELASVRSASANALSLRDQNQDLAQALELREQEIQRLQQENDTLSSGELKQWFLTGGGVLFGGILLGLVLPNIRRRRRSDW
jgi:SH3 domain protein